MDESPAPTVRKTLVTLAAAAALPGATERAVVGQPLSRDPKSRSRSAAAVELPERLLGCGSTRDAAGMTDAPEFHVPLADLTVVHVAPAEQVETRAEPRRVEPWSGHLGTAPDGGGPGDADGD